MIQVRAGSSATHPQSRPMHLAFMRCTLHPACLLHVPLPPAPTHPQISNGLHLAQSGHLSTHEALSAACACCPPHWRCLPSAAGSISAALYAHPGLSHALCDKLPHHHHSSAPAGKDSQSSNAAEVMCLPNCPTMLRSIHAIDPPARALQLQTPPPPPPPSCPAKLQ